VAKYFETGCYNIAGKMTGVHRGTVYYWVKKFFNSSFHAKRLGRPLGSGKFSIFELAFVHKTILLWLELEPTTNVVGIRTMLNTLFGRNLSKSTTQVYLSKMGWSWKVPTTFQISKYTVANMSRYVHYLQWVSRVPWSKLKFLDESHIVSKQLHNRKVLGLRNHRTYARAQTIHETSASLTILTSLDPTEPVYMSYREETNTGHDFLDFVIDCCLVGKLVAGDYLILDNAAIHGSMATWNMLQLVLQVFGVNLRFLPAYSPELNPCELVFAKVKRCIRGQRRYGSYIFRETIKAVATVTARDMFGWYKHCIFPTNVLPDLQ